MISEHDSEIWKPVQLAGFETYYEVSNLGRVRRLKRAKGARVGAVLSPHDTGSKLQVSLKRPEIKFSKKIGIHQLVNGAFGGTCPEGMECCHNDGDYKNNIPSNLRWDTHHNNNLDTLKHGTRPMGERHWTKQNPELVKCGEHFSRSRLTDIEAEYIRSMRSRGVSGKHLAKQFGVSQSLICNLYKGRTYSKQKSCQPQPRPT